MQTIKFNAGFDDTQKRMLRTVFNIIVPKLELPDGFTVNCTMRPLNKPSLYAAVARANEKEFRMEMNADDFNWFDATAAFGHEMIHVEQHLKGWLSVRETGDIFTDGIEWKGKHYPALIVVMSGNCLPWEIDAWKRMGELHKYVVSRLPDEDRSLIDISKSTGLSKTWNTDFQPWSACK